MREESHGKPQDSERQRPVRVQRELGVVSKLKESSLGGWGRVFTWGSVRDWESESRLVVVSKLLSCCTEDTSMTDCSAQRSTPKYGNKKNTLHCKEVHINLI